MKEGREIPEADRVLRFYTRAMKTSRIVMALSAAVIMSGCEEKQPQVKTAPIPDNRAKAPAPTSPPAATGALVATGTPAVTGAPTGAPATTGVPGTTGAPAASGGLTVMGIAFPLPAGWKSVPPANTMRLGEILVADSSGDPAKACTVAFSTAGGEVQANIDRWANQVTDAAGQPAKAAMTQRTVAGKKVTIAEFTGTYSGMSEAPKSNWMLRGAIIETPQGLLFAKMFGPVDQMKAAGPGFNAMIDGMK